MVPHRSPFDVASEHFRHPTAALARHYGQAKWLTGGASLVLPPEGDAVYLLPESLPAPASMARRRDGRLDDACPQRACGDGCPEEHRLLAADVAPAGDAMLVARVPADFAHVVLSTMRAPRSLAAPARRVPSP